MAKAEVNAPDKEIDEKRNMIEPDNNLLPWPSGYNLFPHPSALDSATELELVEVSQFDIGDTHSGVLAPLGVSQFLQVGPYSTINLWDFDSDTPRMEFAGHGDGIEQIAVLSDGHIVSACDDGSLILWDAEFGEVIRHLQASEQSPVFRVAALSPNRFVSLGEDHQLHLWDTESDLPLRSWYRSGLGMGLCALSERLIVAGDRGSERFVILDCDQDTPVDVIDEETGRAFSVVDPVRVIDHEKARCSSIVPVDGDRFLSLFPASGPILWSAEGTEPLMEFEAGRNHYRDVTCVTANLFAAVFAGARSGITVWSASSASALVTVEFPGTASGRTLRNICALPSPDPSTGRLIVGGTDGDLSYWEIRAR